MKEKDWGCTDYFDLAWIGEVTTCDMEKLLASGELPPIDQLKFEYIGGWSLESLIEEFFFNWVRDKPKLDTDYLIAASGPDKDEVVVYAVSCAKLLNLYKVGQSNKAGTQWLTPKKYTAKTKWNKAEAAKKISELEDRLAEAEAKLRKKGD
jgi:hypothetical protein